MTQYNRNTLIMSIAIFLITSIGAYKAFIYGFNRGAVKYAPIVQTEPTGLVCGLRYTEPIRCELEYTRPFNSVNQAYNNSNYFLQNTLTPQKQF
jgi:hypothetical protein